MNQPERIGRYEVVRPLGRGAMGRVWLARDAHIDRDVALKVLDMPPDLSEAQRDERQRRFLLEARAAGRLRHPGIVMVFDAGIDSTTGQPYIATEYVEGSSLQQVLIDEVRLPAERIVPMVIQVSHALGHAHHEGIVHRDIKPANLLVSGSGEIRIADFGIAKLAAEANTAPGLVIGSPSFMSPEQVRGLVVDGRSDLFSLGVVLYVGLTGFHPFQGAEVATILYKIVHEEVPPLEQLVPGIGTELASVVRRLLAKDPAARFPSGDDLAGALSRALAAAREPAGPPMAVPFPEAEVPLTAETGAENGRSPGVAAPSATVPVAFPALDPAAEASEGQPARERRRREAAIALLLVIGALITWLAVRPLRDAPPEATLEAAAPRPTGRPTARPTARPAARPTTNMVVLFVNHMAKSRMEIAVDDDVVLTKPLPAPANVFKKIAGQRLRFTVPVPVGERRVTVRIVGSSMDVDVRKSIAGTFVEGKARSLRVSLNPYTDSLSLSWE